MKTKQQLNEEERQRRIARLASWESVILDLYGSFNCQCCSKPLRFPMLGNGSVKDVINFDHTRSDVPVYHITRWLSEHTTSPKNIQTFKSCNFGILCRFCNVKLGSPERRQRIIDEMIAYSNRETYYVS